MDKIETQHFVNVLRNLMVAFEQQCRKLDDNPTYWDVYREAKEVLDGPDNHSDS